MSFLDRPVLVRLMTSQEVLAVLRRFHHVNAAYDEAERSVRINEQTTIREWLGSTVWGDFADERDTCGAWLNQQFDLQVRPARWRIAMSPPKKRTLGELCEFISLNASVPNIEPVCIWGRSCAEAGAFITLRGLLAEQGIDVSHLSPRSSLERYAAQGLPEIVHVLFRVQPKLMYASIMAWPSDALHVLGAIVLVFAMPFFGILSIAHSPFWFIAFAASLAAFVLIWKDSVRRQAQPRHVAWKRLRTFRDLCRVLAT